VKSKLRRVRSRIPFRQLFNIARQQTNTPQIKTDALADALKAAGIEVKPRIENKAQEKPNVA
jgi:hypothetical protein